MGSKPALNNLYIALLLLLGGGDNEDNMGLMFAEYILPHPVETQQRQLVFTRIWEMLES